ncbi:MAG: cytochrome c5 family protein [Massilia sp.]|jgi:cytochrome c5|nr:cytochrome c5 family protein [Massilia sp.]MDB5951938.1 cytochrome c5 family protein [Massilia sp.]
MKPSKFLPFLILIAMSAAAAAAAPAAPSAADLVKGEKIYGATCLACHGAGVMGAPKSGDKAAWKPRLAKGVPTMYASAVDGVRMMPPKGGNMMLKNEDVKAAVDYMVSKSK